MEFLPVRLLYKERDGRGFSLWNYKFRKFKYFRRKITLLLSARPSRSVDIRGNKVFLREKFSRSASVFFSCSLAFSRVRLTLIFFLFWIIITSGDCAWKREDERWSERNYVFAEFVIFYSTAIILFARKAPDIGIEGVCWREEVFFLLRIRMKYARVVFQRRYASRSERFFFLSEMQWWPIHLCDVFKNDAGTISQDLGFTYPEQRSH